MTHYYYFYKKLEGVFTFHERNMTFRYVHCFVHSLRDFSWVIEPSEHDGNNFKLLKGT